MPVDLLEPDLATANGPDLAVPNDPVQKLASAGNTVYWSTSTPRIWSSQGVPGDEAVFATSPGAMDVTSAVAANSARVYWLTAAGTGYLVPRAGGTPQQFHDEYPSQVIAASESHVAIGGDNGFRVYSSDGTDLDITGSSGVACLAIVEPWVYWPDGVAFSRTNLGTGVAESVGDAGACMGNGTTLFRIGAGHPAGYDIDAIDPVTSQVTSLHNVGTAQTVDLFAADADFLYYRHGLLGARSIYRIPVGGGMDEYLFPYVESINSSAVTTDALYWSDTAGTLNRFALP